MLWIDNKSASFYRGGAPEVGRFNEAVSRRREEYPYSKKDNCKAVKDISEDGYSIIEQAFDLKVIKKLKEEFESCLRNGTVKTDKYFTTVLDPLLNCPTILDVAFGDIITSIASEYFECCPALGTFNFRRSYINAGGPYTTQLFHCDPNSIKFIKFFIYLNDVMSLDDGPLCLVPASLRKKPVAWDSKYRWEDEEIKKLYGQDAVTPMLASTGDLIVATTNAFHRGAPPEKQERTMLTLNYVVHPEEWKSPQFKIKTDDFNKLEEHKKPLADFLVKV